MNETEQSNEQNRTAPPGEETHSHDELLAENLALKQIIKLRDAREVLTTAFADRGARSPGLLFAYAIDDLQFDETGGLENASALLRKIEKAFPEQFEHRETVSSINGGSGGSSNLTSVTRESLAKMRPAEIAALDWNEVKRVISGK